jgi:hypothetical protein
LTSDGATQRIDIAEGVVMIQGSAADQRCLRDPNRALEKWLLRTGSQYLGPDLLRVLLAE